MSGHHFTDYNIFKSVWYYFFERGFSEEKISVSALVDASWTCKIDAVSGLLKEKKKKEDMDIYDIYKYIFLSKSS